MGGHILLVFLLVGGGGDVNLLLILVYEREVIWLTFGEWQRIV